jgi:hypothetical protein
LDSFQKGSKKFRKILDNEQICNTDLSSLVSVNSFAGITNTPIPENEDLVDILGSWNKSFLPNAFREFIFLCRNNQLRVGVRAAHFQQRADYRCIFCRLINSNTSARETFTHLLEKCPVIDRILSTILAKFDPKISKNSANFPNAYWYGKSDNKINQSLLLFYDTFRHTVWKFKLRRTLPTYDSFEETLLAQLKVCVALRRNLLTDLCLNFNSHLFAQAMG